MLKFLGRVMSGWTCPYCGTYVNDGERHQCSKGF